MRERRVRELGSQSSLTSLFFSFFPFLLSLIFNASLNRYLGRNADKRPDIV